MTDRTGVADLRERVERDGFAVVDDAAPTTNAAGLRAEAERLKAADGGGRAGVRGVLGTSGMFDRLAQSGLIRSMVEPVLGPGAFVARSILFDKTPGANWDVAWHQDTTIAVYRPAAGRRPAPLEGDSGSLESFGPWSVKGGVPHVRPPAGVLERMLTVRTHLDDCGPGNGPLLAVPGSHRRGILAGVDLEECNRLAVACTAPAGAAVLMRPLILHASRRAVSPSHRRVLHLEFAADPLPGGLEWARL